MTISHLQISTPPSNERRPGSSLPDNQSPTPGIISNSNSRITEFRLSGSKQSKRQFSNRNKTATSDSQRPHRFRPQRQHRDHENLVQCRAETMATRLSPSHHAPLESPVETAAPRVTLRNHFAHPFDSAIAAARTCYAPRLIGPEEITDKQRVTIGAATYFGGHDTVYQHALFEFGLENISRQFVWSFLHAHPFYNSEQQSQRYVRLARAQAYVPPVATAENPKFGAAEREIYERAIARAWDCYRELTQLLQP